MSSVKFKGGPVTIAVTDLDVGKRAPEYVLAAPDLSDKKVGGKPEKAQLLVVVPSLDTPVCATETRKFNEEAASIEGAEVIVISMDLPFAAARFCTTEGIKNLTVCSDFRKKTFAKAYGVLIVEGPLAGLTCRAVFVVDKNGMLTYKEIVGEMTEEPDYAAALAALKKAV